MRVGQRSKLIYRWAVGRWAGKATRPIDLSVRGGLPRAGERCRLLSANPGDLPGSAARYLRDWKSKIWR
jgi:hypothetical protein